MARRTGWRNLDTSYRSRLIGAGKSGNLTGAPLSPTEVQKYWEQGGDLRGGRSHRPVPRGGAPREATERASVGLTRTEDMQRLIRWRRRAPAWIPKGEATMGWDTAAILSQVDIPPNRWKKVTFNYINPPTGPVIMTVTPKGIAYPRTVTLPDASSASEVLSMISNPAAHGRTKAEQKKLEQLWSKGQPMDVEVVGSPGPSPRGRLAA